MADKGTKRLVVGMLAHVDAGKTTLSEAMLFTSGRLRRLGRVDHRDAFLDTDAQERERGITIFSKQAELGWKNLEITLLDTPGHADLFNEMERTLGVLDCAILVVSAADGVEGYTHTLWRLLERCNIPVFIFINKMDQPGADRAALSAALKKELGEGCIDLAGPDWMEQAALCGDEETLSRYLAEEALPGRAVTALIQKRRLFPCIFGSALKLWGVEALLEALADFAPIPDYPEEFAARIFKIGRDPQGARLSYMKITGGRLRVKSSLSSRRPDTPGDQAWEDKVNQIRIYSGAKYRLVEEAEAGQICAVTGLGRSRAGDGLGAENGEPYAPALEPVLNYRLILPPDCNLPEVLQKLRQLEEELPQLHLSWNEDLGELHVQLMGEVQQEVLKRLILDRFGLEVSFGEGGILYRETIESPVEGVGHYEPLRHYAEVHLLLEPGAPGSGLCFASRCPEDMLVGSWQRLILSYLMEREHPGVLTASPITDMRISLIAGRAHLKHTEGGDFRQAAFRALRQGLMGAKSILLEPWYDFRIELPGECLGRAMTDLQRMGASIQGPENQGELSILTGSVPVAEARSYARELRAYTRGRGRLSCTPKGYAPCREQAAVVEALGYDPQRDLENSSDSVFCANGAGFLVKWDRVREYMHVESPFAQPRPAEPGPRAGRGASSGAAVGSLAEDKALLAIFERTYGPVKQSALFPKARPGRAEEPQVILPPREEGPEYLLVDGYNIIYAWEDLQAVARENLDAARQLLMDLLSNYQGYKGIRVILVFDAYKVPGNPGTVERYHNIDVVYTKEAETADAYIERASHEIAKQYRVRVATSDGMEQLIILGNGALRVPAQAFRAEVEDVSGQISAVLAAANRKKHLGTLEAAMERAMRQSAKGEGKS